MFTAQTQTPTEVICFDVDPPSLHPSSAETVSGEMDERKDRRLKECSVKMSDTSPEQHARRFRARLMEDLIKEWSIYEVWMRGKLRQEVGIV